MQPRTSYLISYLSLLTELLSAGFHLRYTGTISSTHIPTGASAMHAVELMLSHLDIPPNVPTLLRFVNDMLISTYLPEPRNEVVSMWLIRAATRVVDTCPAKRLYKVFFFFF